MASLQSGGSGKEFEPALFRDCAEFLHSLIRQRAGIVERIEGVLNAQRKPPTYWQDRALLTRLFEDCLYSQPLKQDQVPLLQKLEQAHWAAGFRPRPLAGLHSDLIHPGELMTRAFHFWESTRWPGRNGRLHFAQTLFHAYILRNLEFLSLRIWDGDLAGSGVRLRHIQTLLDELWRSSPADQPAFVRDARWLIPLAQSVPTDELAPYLEVMRLAADQLPEADSLEIQRAHVRMLGGHLTSQIRHLCLKDGAPIDSPAVVLRTRTSNALDFALLIQGLVALLKAYQDAVERNNDQRRFAMAGAILQGISPDPEVFLNRLDLLGAYSMMEHVFIETDAEGQVSYSALGLRHVRLFEEYRALIEKSRFALLEDCPRFRPNAGGISSYGVIFGTPTNLTDLMAMKTLQREAETRYSLEDVFDDADTGAAKLAWVDALRKMPYIPDEVQRQYDYPHKFAGEVHERIEQELRRPPGDVPRTGRLLLSVDAVSDVPARYWASTDQRLVDEGKAVLHELAQVRHLRQEGHFLVSYESPDGWAGLKKDVLEEVLAEGKDARVRSLPAAEARILRLMGGELIGA